MRGKQRPRATSRGGFASVYTPKETVNAEAWIKQCAISAGARVMEGPLRVSIAVYVPIPPSWSKKKRARADADLIWPTGKPDADNIAKLCCDALNKIAWKDDAQIISLLVTKRYSTEAATYLTVEAI